MKTFIIAEAGVNHNGDLEIAKRLVEAAAKAGADAVKFQTFKANKLVSIKAPKAEYQKQTTGSDESQLAMISKLQLSMEDHYALIEHCKLNNIMFLSSAFDEESLAFLEKLNMPIYKIPSGEVTNLKMLRQIASYYKPIIMSTGMCELDEIKEAVDCLKNNGAKDITLLHCNTQYPTPYEDVNLLAMKTLKDEFMLPVGYSDHTLGIEVPLAAVGLGACVIEKHFTLDNNMEGPDHRASIEPEQLKAMVDGIRHINLALGSSEKRVSASEAGNRLIARKSVVAKRNIKSGELFSEENLCLKRPGNGINAKFFDEMLNKVAKYDYQMDDLIALDELEK